jgi:TolB-like protein/tetratricopeptide (TPR) repeat protein
MSDVFISYAHSTAREARAAADTLRGLGYTVWLDDDLPTNRAFTHAIQEELTKAKAALVIWSADAAESEWVLSEANRARETRKLVQVCVDGARLPMPFDQIQCADLAGWSGEGEHPAWGKVAASIADLVRGRAQTRAALVVPAAPAEPLLAVLAFDNLSGDPETAYFSDGVSEEILQTVARAADLKVIGRTSSFQLRGADKAVRKVVADLKATHILDGSVRRSGSKVRVAANLIECESQTTLWSDRYDRNLTDAFVLWDEIAASVAAALKTAFAKSPPPPPIDPTVLDLFLRARYGAAAAGFEEARRRVTMLEEVVSRAPAFARGWASLALLRATTLRVYRAEAVAAGMTRDQVVEAAETALRLDPHMGLAYQALGWLEPFAAYGEREALNEKALGAASNDAWVLGQMGSFCSVVGRLEEALAFTRRAQELDPLAPDLTNQLGVFLTLEGRVGEAGRLFDAAVARWPEAVGLAGNGMQLAGWRRDRAKLEGLIRTWSAAAADSLLLRNAIWFANNLIESDAESIKGWLEEQQAELARTGTVPLYVPCRLIALGLTDEAFALIDRASFAHMFDPEGPMPSGTSYPGLIFSRTSRGKFFFQDPRFPRLCAKLGLCDYWVETGKWPDCADEVAYDFRAEARRLAGAHRPAG